MGNSVQILNTEQGEWVDVPSSPKMTYLKVFSDDLGKQELLESETG